MVTISMMETKCEKTSIAMLDLICSLAQLQGWLRLGEKYLQNSDCYQRSVRALFQHLLYVLQVREYQPALRVVSVESVSQISKLIPLRHSEQSFGQLLDLLQCSIDTNTPSVHRDYRGVETRGMGSRYLLTIFWVGALFENLIIFKDTFQIFAEVYEAQLAFER